MDERSPAMPERLGRYEIVERLSAGGMGEVFVARFAAPGGFMKPVALKRIHPHLADDPQFINMLHDEANVAAAVRHPNIVSTIDVGFEDNNHFVVLDFVSGDPLSRLIRELKRRGLTMPPWVMAWVGAETAAALHAAHEATNLQGERLEIVHRDVSLQNIMLSDAGRPMLFDFGVAKAKQRIVQTSHGELKGKLSYMAPETFRGAPVDRTVDVFSLGVVLYEMLTNVSPFQRSSDLETITALTSAEIVPPSRLAQAPPASPGGAPTPPIDVRLDRIVLTAMARDREARYPTAAHVEKALREWARSTGVGHEAGPVASWIAVTFPERIAARQALLARVANPTRLYRPAAAPSSGRSGPHTPAIGAVTPQTGPSGRIEVALAPGTDPRAVVTRPSGPIGHDGGPPGTDPGALAPPSTGLVSVGGVSAVAVPPASGKARTAAIAVAGVVAGGALVYFLAARTRGADPETTSAAAAGSSQTVATAAPPATATAPTAAAAATGAPATPPSASALSPSASASASVAARPPTAGPRARTARPPSPGEPTKARGPIKRDYE